MKLRHWFAVGFLGGAITIATAAALAGEPRNSSTLLVFKRGWSS